ncbi:unnamed protein product [Cochlearia groenlandica]
MSEKVLAEGGTGGGAWNDGIFDGVKKVSVGRDKYCVTYVKFKYDKDSAVEAHEHGVKNETPQEFSINYPHEYITSVEGTYARPYSWTGITSLTFKTSQGRTSPTFGNKKFVLSNNGQKLVGFHGRSGNAIDALGAHFLSESAIFPTKLTAQGGPGGGTWDDGVYSDVRKVYVGGDGACVTRIIFDYVKDGVPVTSRTYGLLHEDLQEFLLDPNEFIISVEGTYGSVYEFGSPVITSLAFMTSKGRTSLTFGAKKFVLQGNGRKLVGFHGRSGIALDAIGAHFASA